MHFSHIFDKSGIPLRFPSQTKVPSSVGWLLIPAQIVQLSQFPNTAEGILDTLDSADMI